MEFWLWASRQKIYSKNLTLSFVKGFINGFGDLNNSKNQSFTTWNSQFGVNLQLTQKGHWVQRSRKNQILQI